MENVIQQNLRLHLDIKASECITLKSRVEGVFVARKSSKSEQGILLYQDIKFKSKNSPFQFSFRYALFDTDSYDSRIYAYESHILNVFSIPAMYHQGTRIYAVVRYDFLRRYSLWVRWANTFYSNRSTIGSGSEQIDESVKTTLSFQLRVKL